MKKKIFMIVLVVVVFSMFTSTAFAGYNSGGFRVNCDNCQVVYGLIMTSESVCVGNTSYAYTGSHGYGFLWQKTCNTPVYETVGNPYGIGCYCTNCGLYQNLYTGTHTEYMTHNSCGSGTETWCSCVYNQVP